MAKFNKSDIFGFIWIEFAKFRVLPSKMALNNLSQVCDITEPESKNTFQKIFEKFSKNFHLEMTASPKNKTTKKLRFHQVLIRKTEKAF